MFSGPERRLGAVGAGIPNTTVVSGGQTRIPSDTQVTNSEPSNNVTAVSLTVVIPIAAPQNYLVSTDLDWLTSGQKSSSSIVPIRRSSLIFPITARRINEAAHTVCVP